ncbi:MAG TPA: hypothetical protein VFF69_00680 [Phycisphaerales bacterium]|nr:hypothetical protein [Phycisphaerales bacterium]
MVDPDSFTPALPARQPPGSGDGLEVRIVRTGESLLESLGRAIDGMPDPPRGPQALARRLGIDKVLASRVLAALRSADPLFVVHRSPGPEPLRRTLDALAREGVDGELVAGARAAVDQFEQLIRDEVGDRSALDAIVAAWLPEARREFELRRKQAAHKAMSHLRGALARAIMATVILAPSESDPDRLDVVWLNGLFGIARLRPRAGVKIVTRRFAPEVSQQRRPLNLSGEPIEEMHQATLEEFSSRPTPSFDVVRAGDAIHYSLAGARYGPRSAVDLVMAEVNRAEMRRAVPSGSGRKGYVFAEISTPAESLQLDAILHRDVYPGSSPSIRVYDTSFEGVADANNPARDIDVLDMLESVETLGGGVGMLRSPDVPRYPDLLRHVYSRLGWRDSEFRAFRCRVEYPVYGSQVAMLFDPPTD